MIGRLVELRRISDNTRICSQAISADSGSHQRRELAYRLCARHSAPSECYVVESRTDSKLSVLPIETSRYHLSD